MKKPLIVGNWKMFKTVEEAVTLAQSIKAGTYKIQDAVVVICPPFTSLYAVSKQIEGSNVALGAQNMHPETEGAFTGETSPAMLKEIGCRYIVLGHSERRQYFHETDAFVNEKTKAALKYSLIPIVCIGESLKEREAQHHLTVVKTQFEGSLADLSKDDASRIVIAYEPVWAIGTGKTATPEQAEQMHSYIRRLLIEKYGQEIAARVPILYGGSVKPDNIGLLIDKPNVDGALVGGASLKAESFCAIVSGATEQCGAGAK